MARPDMFTDEEKNWLTEHYAEASWEDILSLRCQQKRKHKL